MIDLENLIIIPISISKETCDAFRGIPDGSMMKTVSLLPTIFLEENEQISRLVLDEGRGILRFTIHSELSLFTENEELNLRLGVYIRRSINWEEVVVNQQARSRSVCSRGLGND